MTGIGKPKRRSKTSAPPEGHVFGRGRNVIRPLETSHDRAAANETERIIATNIASPAKNKAGKQLNLSTPLKTMRANANSVYNYSCGSPAYNKFASELTPKSPASAAARGLQAMGVMVGNDPKKIQKAKDHLRAIVGDNAVLSQSAPSISMKRLNLDANAWRIGKNDKSVQYKANVAYVRKARDMKK